MSSVTTRRPRGRCTFPLTGPFPSHWWPSSSTCDGASSDSAEPHRRECCMTAFRPMAVEDVEAAELVWSAAFGAMRAQLGIPLEDRTDASIRRSQGRLRHLLGTDPGRSWIAAEDDGSVAGMAQALVRDQLWVLSLLAVEPGCQQRHVGKRLLDHALESMPESGAGMIFSSPDPRAMHRYTLAGFDLHPSMSASGVVRQQVRRVPTGVRMGTLADRPFVDDIDREVRGSAHGADVDHLLGEGCALLVRDGAGYAIARGASPV